MPRPAKGTRLWLRPARRSADGRTSHGATWIILDGKGQYPTGCGADDCGRAEQALAAYIARKYEPPRRDRDIADIPIPDVITIYLRDKAASQANPKALAERCRRLLAWWGDKTLAEVTSTNCRGYANSRQGAGGARRDLEDLRSAIRYHAREGLHRAEISVLLPEKGSPRERWLTRDEAARLLWTCWRMREKQKRSHKGLDGEAFATRKHTLRHLARFILVGLYTGTRASAIASASWAAASGRSYVDVERGVFYRLPQGARATKKRQPPVPLPERLLAHIRRWKETGVSREYLVEYHGAPVKSVKVSFRSAVTAAGLGGNVTPHTLRHTAATWLMQAGVPIWEAAGFLGMSAEMLERTYGHHHPDHMRGAAHALNTGANKTPMKPLNRTGTKSGKSA